jgi:hypothetical protein
VKKIEIKPKETRQKINDVLAKSSFKTTELKTLKLGIKKKKCLEYKRIRDKNGNVIGLSVREIGIRSCGGILNRKGVKVIVLRLERGCCKLV